MSDCAKFIVLCEDKQSQVFICRALRKCGATEREIRRLPLPSGGPGGAGEAYVIERYPTEVQEFRRRNARMTCALVVHVDADPGHTVADRHRQLAERLKEEELPPRSVTERLSELIPKRNIETWIYALDDDLRRGLGSTLDENTDYRKLHKQERVCAKAAEAFAEYARKAEHPKIVDSIPSLRDGIVEFARILR